MSGTMIDVFSGDAFSSVTLTEMVNVTYPNVPTFLRDLRLAPAEGMTTLEAAFEAETGGIRLIPSSPRGAPPSQQARPTRTLRKLPSVHFAREVEVNADEILTARARGLTDRQTLQNLINQRVDGPAGVKVEWALTLEHMLLGAIDGVVYDADNTTVLYDYFDWMGTTRPTAAVLNFSGMNATDSAVFAQFGLTLKRRMIKALNGMPTNNAQMIALAGDNFFDALLTSKEYVSARKNGTMGNQAGAEAIMNSTPYAAVILGGILWVNYRGTDDGSTVAVPTDEARMFMRGVPGLFQTLYAPADTLDTISDVGLPMYMLNLPERQTSRRAVFELQSNPLIACTRPQSLIRITKS